MIDNECLKICNALNKLPSVRTTESCCGHGVDDFMVWFYVSDIRVMNALGRLMSRNYSPYSYYKNGNGEYVKNWMISLTVDDVMDFNKESLFCLVGNKNNPNLFKEADEMSDYLIELWNDFCKYSLKVDPFFKPDDEYRELI